MSVEDAIFKNFVEVLDVVEYYFRELRIEKDGWKLLHNHFIRTQGLRALEIAFQAVAAQRPQEFGNLTDATIGECAATQVQFPLKKTGDFPTEPDTAFERTALAQPETPRPTGSAIRVTRDAEVNRARRVESNAEFPSITRQPLEQSPACRAVGSGTVEEMLSVFWERAPEELKKKFKAEYIAYFEQLIDGALDDEDFMAMLPEIDTGPDPTDDGPAVSGTVADNAQTVFSLAKLVQTDAEPNSVPPVAVALNRVLSLP